MPSFPHLGAFESTKIYGSNEDILSTTRHLEFWRSDLEMLYASGLRDLRYPVPWHRIERKPGDYDWTWLDRPLRLMAELDLRPILDPLHHISIPDWLTDGFANPRFPDIYCRFVREVAERYPWVDRYTVVNEPLPTTILCGLMGIWYPYRRSDADFVAMALNVARAICLASAELRAANSRVELVHIDACEHHRALDLRAEGWVEFLNDRRFLYHDLILGRVNQFHPLRSYLNKYGFTEEQARWFEDHPAPFDVLGLDYYAHSEMEWASAPKEPEPVLRFPCQRPRGFCEVASDYVERYRVPILLSETNVGGTPTDRLTWLRFMEQEAEKLAKQSDFRGFCWFPSIDATDWSSLCTQARFELCPMGIWGLDENRRQRHSSPLSEWYVKLALGEASWRDIPIYPLHPPLDRDLGGFLLLMEGR